MNLPSFTAEAALYRTLKRYRLKGDRNTPGEIEGIVPQRIWYCSLENIVACNNEGCSEFPYLECRAVPRIFT